MKMARSSLIYNIRRSFSSKPQNTEILGSTVQGFSNLLADTAAFSQKFSSLLNTSKAESIRANLRGLYAQHFLFLEAVSNYCYFSNASVDNSALQEYREKLENNQTRMDKLLPDYRVRPTLLRLILQFQGFDSGISALLYGNEINIKIKTGFEKALLEQITETMRGLYDLEEEEEFEKQPLIDFLKELRDSFEEQEIEEEDLEVGVNRVSEECFRFLSKVAWRI